MPAAERRRRRRVVRWVGYLGALSLAVLLIAAWQFVAPTGGSGGLVPLSIAQGASVKQVSRELKEQGLVRSRFWFEVWVWLTGTEGKFQAGDYRLPVPTTTVSLVRLLTGGVPPTSELTLRLIEGWTIGDMARYLSSSGWVRASEFARYVTQPATAREAAEVLPPALTEGKPSGTSLEGYLFPDTYRLYQDSAPTDLVAKMLANFERKFEPAWRAEVKRRGYTAYQALIVASIVEREVARDEDRALVADIFWRRLEAGRGLEADSTINYVTGKSLPAVTAQDLAVDSPYNTYRYRGLPPGPISNPGQTALRAAVYPRQNPYWYFLTTRQGEAIYSRTFEEHKSAKAKYLR